MASHPASTNPFSTRYLRPGALPFLRPDGSPWQRPDQWGPPPWHGQIVGPHGSGKTCLLHHLAAELPAGFEVQWYRYSPSRRRVTLQRQPAARQVFLDGWEQLRWWQQRLWLTWARFSGRSLLVTSHHADRRLPVLWRTVADADLLHAIVARLTGRETLPPNAVAAAHAEHPNNLREALFALYDTWEAGR